MSDPEFYKSAGAGVVQVNARLAELELELLIAYERWEELESLKNPA
jgi:ATP-binding cassette subfamily F protein uup